MKKLRIKGLFKVTGLLLVSIIFALLLTSCKPGEPADTSTSEQITTEAPKPIVLLENGEFRAKIISGVNKTDDASLTVYTRFVTKLKSVCGVDSVKTGTDRKLDEEACEILFGYTSYEASKELYGRIGFDEYAVAVSGNKIMLAGYNSDALYSAMMDLTEYIDDNIKDGKVEIPQDLFLTGEAKSANFPIIFSGDVPTFSGFEYATFNPAGDDHEQITLTQTSAESFTAYRKTLEESGYSLYAENTIAENLFATYTKGEVTVHTYFVPYSKETRIVVSKGALLPSVEEVKYTKKCEPSFTLLGCAAGNASNVGGLGCVIGLEDGSFIIIDGGYNTSTDARLLYSKLKELSPDKSNIIVRAWYITHAHGDHYGNLIAFSKAYSKNQGVTVESFIYNFCNTYEQTQYSSSGSFGSVVDTVKKYWSDSKVYKCLTGQVFRFAGCDMEVLYCMSDFLPKIIGEERADADKTSVDGNIQNVVVRFKMCDQKILVTGDTTKVNVDEMCDRYGSELKSDLLTVPHHGHNEDRYRARNGTTEFYGLVDPETVLWPAADGDFLKRSKWDGTAGGKFEANYYLLNLLHVKETVVAGDDHTTLPLPYKPK